VSASEVFGVLVEAVGMEPDHQVPVVAQCVNLGTLRELLNFLGITTVTISTDRDEDRMS
jgi:hypothetical protein